MRILHVLDHSVPLQSGYAFRTLSILKHQRALGWETAHVTSAKHTLECPPECPSLEEIDGLTFYRTRAWGGGGRQLPLIHHLAIIHGLYQRLCQLVPRFNPHVLHAHSPSLVGVAAIRASRRFGLPVVYEVRALWEDGAVDHGTSRHGDLRYRLSRAVESWVLRNADAVTTICEGLRGEILARGLPKNKVSVIPNAVDPLRFRINGLRKPELARRLGVEGCRVVGFIGSFYGYEGLALLLRALPAMLQRVPSMKLLLVGGGYEAERLKRQAADGRIADKVIFAGPVPHDEVQDYYSLIDVLAYPRERTRVTEIVTPLKPLEAMAQGRSLVASDVGGHLELIRDGQTGLLFRAGDPQSLADAVVRMLESPELASAMRERARRFVEIERTWTASVARYADVYGPLVNTGQYGVAH